MDQTEALIIETIDRHREEILEFARDIYSHAELGYKEFQTSGKFVKKMEQLGLRTENIFSWEILLSFVNGGGCSYKRSIQQHRCKICRKKAGNHGWMIFGSRILTENRV